MLWLDEAPTHVAHDAFGTFRGPVASSNLDAVACGERIGRLARLAREKRWQWFGVAGERVAFGGAIVRTGYAARAFFWVFEDGKLIADEEVTLPRVAVQVTDTPGRGTLAQLRWGGSRATIIRASGRVEVSASIGKLELAASIDVGAATEFTAICPVAGGGTNLTQKSSGLPARGVVRMGSRSLTLRPGAVGMLDYTHGLLARRTDWLWAIGAAPGNSPLAFNLISGFNDDLESVAWIGPEPQRVSPATFARDPADPLATWRVQGVDGDYDLTLTPYDARSDDTHLGLVSSRYVMPLGRWSGTLLGHTFEGRGVAEDHSAVW